MRSRRPICQHARVLVTLAGAIAGWNTSAGERSAAAPWTQAATNQFTGKVSPYRELIVTPPALSPEVFSPDPQWVPAFPVTTYYRERPAYIPHIDFSTSSPLSPEKFNPDPAADPLSLPLLPQEGPLRPVITENGSPAPQPPPQFNPDPGAVNKPPSEPYFRKDPRDLPPFGSEPLPDNLALPREPVRLFELLPFTPPTVFGWEPLPTALQLPRAPVRTVTLVATESSATPYGEEPLPKELQLPRGDLWRNLPAHPKFSNNGLRRDPAVPVPPDSEVSENRWRVPFSPWRRYTSGDIETPYQHERPYLWHPYRQSYLKGDVPVIGQDIFLNLTASTLTEVEARRIPVPSGISSALPGSSEFFGRGEQLSIQNNLAFAVDLFKGETVFKPVEWQIRLQPVFNINHVYTKETGVVSPDVRGQLGGGPGNNQPPPNNGGVQNPGDIDAILNGQVVNGGNLTGERNTVRTRDHWALQEAFAEIHISDLSDNYDFIAFRGGNQTFISDFRGLIFNDTNLGFRLFGNAWNNRIQYNAVGFDMREKDTNSELNTFDARNQNVIIANLYWQDFLTKGYTAQLSFHANLDQSDFHYDRNGNIVRPEPLGSVRPHDVNAYYVGWAGDGHIGRWNVSHALYYAFGHDDFNGLAGKSVDISAWMAAAEVSYDRDWMRYKASLIYASGDNDADDGTASGFDTIVDNPNFIGGPFSFYVRQGFNLGGTVVNLKQRNSLVPNLRTSKTQGQANFVNPGVFIAGLGLEAELTPKLKAFGNANYIRFVAMDSIRTALLTDKIDYELGWDLSTGVQYRPFLTDNVILSAGFGVLIPGRGYRDIYKTNPNPVPGFGTVSNRGEVDDFLFSAVLALTLTY